MAAAMLSVPEFMATSCGFAAPPLSAFAAALAEEAGAVARWVAASRSTLNTRSMLLESGMDSLAFLRLAVDFPTSGVPFSLRAVAILALRLLGPAPGLT